MGKKIISAAAALLIFCCAVLAASAEEVYTIDYDYGSAQTYDGEVYNPNPDSYVSGEGVTLAQPSCPGFEFAGWFADPGYTYPVTIIDPTLFGDIILYAKWYEMTYTVSYVLTDPAVGITESEITNANPYARLAGEGFSLADPMCSEPWYIFEGWYADSSFTVRVTAIEPNTLADVTLYAKWSNESYGINYDYGVAAYSAYPIVNPNPTEYEYSVEVLLSDPGLADPVYTFDGWYTDGSFSERIYSIEPGMAGDITLFAKWEITQYPVDYILTDGVVNENDIHNNNPSTIPGNESLPLNDPVSEDKNYVFGGWYLNEDFSGDRIYTLKVEDNSAITLYAKWEEAIYTVTYDYGAVNIRVLPIENYNVTQYTYGQNPPLFDIYAEGFIFNGWCTDAALRNHVTAIPPETYGDITLYADFTEKTYTIEYVLGYGAITAQQVVNTNTSARTVTQSVVFSDPETIDVFYRFDGWYLDPGCTVETKRVDAYTAENVTVYAKWVRIVSYLPVWGDASVSNQLSAEDARLALRNAAGLETFTELQLRLADVDNSGDVTSRDARLILRMSAGLEKTEDIINAYNLPEIKIVDGEIVFE